MLLTLLIRGLTLPGAWEGIYYYLDCFWLCLLNSGTSFVAGFVVFSVLGFMAQKQGVSVDAVVESVESFITTVTDLFPKWFRVPLRHKMFVFAICASSFLIHLTLVTEGGIYIFQLIDFYGCTRVSQNFVAVCADRLSDIIEDMTGQRPSVFFKLCWKYFIPLLTLTSFILYLVDYKALKFNNWYVYPDWAYALGWTMTLSSVLMVPLCAAVQMCLTAGTFRQRLSVLCRPAEDKAWKRRAIGEEETTVELRTSAVTT
ncbi:hypothetical protein FQN60_016189 [Etheostoma spectabile]|uniref:Uncharacterized protein n=1 Tax=Etheostoma spectabile TaxID=54343 RepID=A0A5J5D058_9PERO|nr:hypothetical protein FQN60_016189 [Etheostoma spectabile]